MGGGGSARHCIQPSWLGHVPAPSLSFALAGPCMLSGCYTLWLTLRIVSPARRDSACSPELPHSTSERLRFTPEEAGCRLELLFSGGISSSWESQESLSPAPTQLPTLEQGGCLAAGVELMAAEHASSLAAWAACCVCG